MAAGGQPVAMAAQPPRQPPNNLLFCGPPPTLPHVVFLPSDIIDNTRTTDTVTPFAANQTNDVNTLQEINNVGVPTTDNETQLENCDYGKENNHFPLTPESYLRRTNSFDISDIYHAQIDSEIELSAFRHRRSEPDLSKYGLFVEAEVTMDCGPHQPAPLVLNNPFYDGSCTLDTTQFNQAMVMLPENYLAFEDSFVPTWNYKTGYMINPNISNDLYYDGIPLVPSNDPWSAYCNENATFGYYSPHYETPIGDQEGVHYMPLTDFDYAIPQYMGLPVVEPDKYENYNDINQNFICNTASDKNDTVEISSLQGVPDTSLTTVSNSCSEEQKSTLTASSTVRQTSLRSEESINADISNDVTSSLAFVPSSKSSQVPDDTDDTSDDTSPCSTDYHEASALDLVRSVDELSCCDSTDFSQSRDETSPAASDLQRIPGDEINEITGINNNITGSNVTNPSLPLSKLPSIPLPTKLNSISSKVMNDFSNINASTKASNPEVDNVSEQLQTNNTNLAIQCVKNESETFNNLDKNGDTILQNRPQPPAVPTSWLAPKVSNAIQPPQINIQNPAGVSTDVVMSSKLTSQPSPKEHPITQEPKPSCSFLQPVLPLQTVQLKPEKHPKEVEVSEKHTLLKVKCTLVSVNVVA